MGNSAGVRRDFDTLEKRRFQAIRQFEQGRNQFEIARQVKVGRKTAARWVLQYRARGKPALQKAGRAGRKPRLNEKQHQQLSKLLLAGPERLGYETPLMTWPRVVHLIGQQFGVRYHEGPVWKLLVHPGWGPQRPMGRAGERNQERSNLGRRRARRPLKSVPGRAHAAFHR
jgi:transposase